MLSIPDNVRQALVALVPASLINEISCFVFYEHHPRDKRNVDIIIGTLHGEVQEFYRRDLVDSTCIDSSWKPQDIKILRNTKCEVFYLVSYENDIAILSRKGKLQVHNKINNVDSYKIEDSTCTGQAILKIICKDDGVPLLFDDNFEKIGDRTEILGVEKSDDCLPLITQLARKLTEAKYSVKCNKKVLKDLCNLRQLAAYSDYKRNSLKVDDAYFQENKTQEHIGPLKIKSHSSWVKMVGQNISVILELKNKSEMPVNNVHILLHTSLASTTYITKVFETTSISPYWKEKTSNTISKNENAAVVLVVDLKEFKYHTVSPIKFSGVITYNFETQDHLIPFSTVHLSSMDTINENFDVLSTINHNANNKYNILALLATSVRTEISLRHIETENARDFNLLNLLCEHLNMEKIANMDNAVVHRISPYHALHGVLVIEKQKLVGEAKLTISLFTRSQDQILAFIHYLHDAMPLRLIATTTGQRITAKVSHLSKHDENICETPKISNNLELKSSMLKQTSLTLEYLDECMMKMNENKNPSVQNKIGSEIDIFAGGVSRFLEFRDKILEETGRHIQCPSIDEATCREQSESMVIDID